jgi:hypothetical protein
VADALSEPPAFSSAAFDARRFGAGGVPASSVIAALSSAQAAELHKATVFRQLRGPRLHDIHMGVHVSATRLLGRPEEAVADQLSCEAGAPGTAARGLLLVGDLGGALEEAPWRAPHLGFGMLAPRPMIALGAPGAAAAAGARGGQVGVSPGSGAAGGGGGAGAGGAGQESASEAALRRAEEREVRCRARAARRQAAQQEGQSEGASRG